MTKQKEVSKVKRHKLPGTDWKKQIPLLPGHIIVGIWVLFTFVMLAWILCASLATSREIMGGQAMLLPSGPHFDNYARAWSANNISVFFFELPVIRYLHYGRFCFNKCTSSLCFGKKCI